MSDKKPESETPRGRAQKFFAASEERENQIKQMIESERAKREANTAKLRALRLAKEEADRATAVATVATAKPSKRKGPTKAGRA